MEINEKELVGQPEVETVDQGTPEVKEPSSKNRGPRPAFRGPRPAGGGRGPRRDRDREKQYDEKVIAINRVSKTVKGGRKMRFSALVAVGDSQGNFGFGTGKANEVPDAIKKALDAAKKNLMRVPVVKGETIPHTVIGKYGACSVFIKPAPAGTGVIAGGPVRAILELAGVKNIYSKVYGSRASINMVRATVNGLKKLKTAGKIASLRGKSIKEIKA